MPTPQTDTIGTLLADPAHAEALRLALTAAYAAGWTDAFDCETFPIADTRLAAAIEDAAQAWQAHTISRQSVDLAPPPPWLARLQEQHE